MLGLQQIIMTVVKMQRQTANRKCMQSSTGLTSNSQRILSRVPSPQYPTKMERMQQ